MKNKFGKLLLTVCGLLLFANLTNAQMANRKKTADNFQGNWIFSETKNGRLRELSLRIKQNGNKLTCDYQNASSKESNGKILSSSIKGNVAIIKVSCDWGGNGIVRITRLKGNRLHWKVIKRNEKKGEFIVLNDQILKLAK